MAQQPEPSKSKLFASFAYDFPGHVLPEQLGPFRESFGEVLKEGGAGLLCPSVTGPHPCLGLTPSEPCWPLPDIPHAGCPQRACLSKSARAEMR